jgi:hypothetical protein
MAIQLKIDTIEEPILITQRMLQQRPYPGGHRYEAVLSGRREWGRWFRGVESQESPTWETQQQIFFAFDGLAGDADAPPEIKVEYLLNSVDLVQVGDDEVVVTGVCSEIVGAPYFLQS